MKSLKILALAATSLFVLTGCRRDPNIISPPDIPDYSSYMSLGEYRNIRYTVKNDYALTDEMLNEELENICLIESTIEPIPNKKAEKGDNVYLMYSGTVDNKPFQNSSTDEYGTVIRLGRPDEITALFEDDLLGMKKDESKKITVDIPENYNNKAVAGKTAEFSIFVVDIIEFTFDSPITDEMVAKCSQKQYNSIEEVRSAMLADMKSVHDFEIYNAVMAQIVKNSDFTSYPKDVLDDLVSTSVKALEQNAASANLSVEEFLKRYVDEADTLDEFKEQVAEQARQYLQLQMVICGIARKENISVTPEEFTEYKTSFAEENGYSDLRTVNLYYTDTTLLMNCLEPKVREWLIADADVPNRYSFE